MLSFMLRVLLRFFFAWVFPRQIRGIFMHSSTKRRSQARGKRNRGVAVFFAHLVHSGQGLAPALGLVFVQQAGLTLTAFERLRIDAEQADWFSRPILVKEVADRGGELPRPVAPEARPGSADPRPLDARRPLIDPCR